MPLKEGIRDVKGKGSRAEAPNTGKTALGHDGIGDWWAEARVAQSSQEPLEGEAQARAGAQAVSGWPRTGQVERGQA